MALVVCAGLLSTLLLAGGVRAEDAGDGEAGLTADQRQEFLDKHNELRRVVSPTAADMKMMKWNYDLEKMAVLWAEMCLYEHGDPNCTALPFSNTGQNLFASTASPSPADAVQKWYDEVKDYTYDTLECTAVCGHYTQVVWAASTQVGCAMKECEPLKGTDWPKGFLVVCNYGPAGNYKGEKPFKSGESCSDCGSFTCTDKLCENPNWNYTIPSSPPESKMKCKGTNGGDEKPNGDSKDGGKDKDEDDSGSSTILPGFLLLMMTSTLAFLME